MTVSPWLIGGALLVGLEFILPSGLAAAVGGTAFLVGLLIYCGWLTSFPAAIGLWTPLATLALFVFRAVFYRVAPGERSVDPDVDAWIGRAAVVVEEIAPGQTGRVMVGGTAWTAVLDDPAGAASAGATVFLRGKSNITWIVSNAPELTPEVPS